MQKPDKIRFFGSTKDPKHVEGAKKYLESYKPSLPPEIKQTLEFQRQIGGMVDALLEFANCLLQIDLSNRIPLLHQFHFFNKANFKIVRRRFGATQNTTAFFVHNGHLFVESQQKEVETLASTQHEIIHAMSYITSRIINNPDRLLIHFWHVGYNNKGKSLTIFDEALTEMINLEIIANHWQNQPTLRQMNTGNHETGYVDPIIIVDELIKITATKNGCKYVDVLRVLQRGKFLGEMRALRILTNAIGKEGMKVIGQFNHDSPDKTIEVCKALGLTKAQAKIEKSRQGQKVRVMEEISPNIVIK